MLDNPRTPADPEWERWKAQWLCPPKIRPSVAAPTPEPVLVHSAEWPHEEYLTIAAGWLAGKTSRMIARELPHRTGDGVNQRANKAGFRFGKGNQPRHVVAGSKAEALVAEIKGGDPAKTIPTGHACMFSPADDARITRAWVAGRSPAETAREFPGRSVDSIKGRAQKLGLYYGRNGVGRKCLAGSRGEAMIDAMQTHRTGPISPSARTGVAGDPEMGPVARPHAAQGGNAEGGE